MALNLPPPSENESDDEAWVIAIARKILKIYRRHGKKPILIWPDPKAPGVSIVGPKETIDVKPKGSKL